jgi:hypothetical protein
VDVEWKAVHEKESFKSVEVPSLDIPEHKSLEDPPLEQPHSALCGDPHPISSTELGVGFEASPHPYQHGTRTSDLKGDFERSKNSRLDLPAPSRQTEMD